MMVQSPCISDDVLKELVKGAGDLNLNTLKNITITKAKILSSSRRFIILDGIQDVSPPILRILSKCKNGVSLNGLTTLSHEQCKAINGFSEIRLDGIKKIDPDSLSILTNGGNNEISLLGLSHIPNNILYLMSQTNSTYILGGIKKLDINQAKLLAESISTFTLPFVDNINDNCFSILNNCKREIHLTGVKKINRNQATIYKNGSGNLKLSGLTEVHPEFIDSLRVFGNSITLNKLKRVGPELAKKIGGLRLQSVYLPSVSEISPEEAFWLGLGAGSLKLPGLLDLEPESAKHLANFLGDLDLSGLKKMSERTSYYLGKHIGNLDLDGILSLDENVAKNLGFHTGTLTLKSIKSLTDESFKNLGKIKDINLKEIYLSENIFQIAKASLFFSELMENHSSYKLGYLGSDSFVGLSEVENFSFKKSLICLFSHKPRHVFSLRNISITELATLSATKMTLDYSDISSPTLIHYIFLFLHNGNLYHSKPKITNMITLFFISRNKGNIELGPIENFDDIGAWVLSHHNGFLYIEDLDNITVYQAILLSAHKGVIALNSNTIEKFNDLALLEILKQEPFQIR